MSNGYAVVFLAACAFALWLLFILVFPDGEVKRVIYMLIASASVGWWIGKIGHAAYKGRA